MKAKWIAAGAAAVLAGCGGGGGGSSDPAPAPSPTAAGQYIGFTADNRTTTATVLDTGKVYVQYSVAGQPAVIAGVVAGTVQSSGGTLTGSGIDYNLEGQGTNAVTLSGSYVAKASLDSTVAYTNGNKSTAHLTYDTTYDIQPTLQAVTGTYSGSSTVELGSDTVTITVDGAGAITGQGTNCRFTGALKPHSAGNVYDVSVAFSGDAGCAYPNVTATGIALVSSGGVLHAMLQTPSEAGILVLASR